MTAGEMFEELGHSLEAHNEYTIKYSKEECDYTTFDFNLKKKKIYSRFMSAAHGITLDELKAVIRQAKELGWLEEEQKQETNLEHYFEYLSTIKMSEFALIDGRVTQCLGTGCSECDFNGDCIEGKFKWLKQPYEKPKYKLTKFEFDLIQTYRDCHESCKISEFKQLIELKDKGYFKCIDHDTKIQDVLKNCEVIQ